MGNCGAQDLPARIKALVNTIRYRIRLPAQDGNLIDQIRSVLQELQS